MIRIGVCCGLLAAFLWRCSRAADRDWGDPSGTWDVVSFDTGAGPENPVGVQMLISREQVAMRRQGDIQVWGETVRIDASRNPSQNDLRSDRGSWLGIFEVESDRLKLVINEPGNLRPGKFQGSPKGLLFKMRRAK